MPQVRIGKSRIGESPRLVAIVTGPDKPAQFSAAASCGADLVELRLDYLSHWPEEKVVRAVQAARRACPLGLIATARTSREGGARRDGFLADDRRRAALFSALLPHVDAVDIELCSPILGDVVAAAHKAGRTAIVSYHHFQSTPSLGRLRALAQLCKAKGGDVVKIVTTAHLPVEMLRLLSLLQERPSHPLAAFAMGRHALLSRLMASFFQSCLLYAALPGKTTGMPPAPGVPDIVTLRDALKKFGVR